MPAPNQRTVLASAARTATTTSPAQTNHGWEALEVVIVTSAGAAFSITPKIEAYDEASDSWFAILTGAVINTLTTTVLRVGRGLTAAANLVVNDLVPPRWRVVVTHGDATSVTYSVGANLV